MCVCVVAGFVLGIKIHLKLFIAVDLNSNIQLFVYILLILFIFTLATLDRSFAKTQPLMIPSV